MVELQEQGALKGQTEEPSHRQQDLRSKEWNHMEDWLGHIDQSPHMEVLVFHMEHQRRSVLQAQLFLQQTHL
jgi:hypothetical protein